MLTTILPVNGSADAHEMSVLYIGTLTPSLMFRISTPAFSSASSKEKEFSKKKVTKIELAALVGTSLSKRVKGKKINKIYFDRNGFRYHGRVKSLADAAREGGLKF